MKQPKWTDRIFDFNFSLDSFPHILERLKMSPLRLKQMIIGLPEEVLIFKPANKWSIKEQIGHLCDLEELHEGRIDDFLNHMDILRAADMSNKATHDADHNNRDVYDLIHEFQSKRDIFVLRLEALSEEVHHLKSIHPRLLVIMRPMDMAYFTVEHDDHHLAAIHYLITTQSQ